MRVLVIGATGTIGRAVVQKLRSCHEVVEASRSKSAIRVDMTDGASIRSMFKKVGEVDAVVSAAGDAKFAPLSQLSEADYQFCFQNKLMGQVSLVRLGVDSVRNGGSFTLTSGVLAQRPMKGSAAISLVNAGLEGFTRACALELPRSLRINCVSPGWVSETLTAMGQDPSKGVPAARVAEAYASSVEGAQTGAVIDAL